MTIRLRPLLMAALLLVAPAWADDWGTIATISSTMGVNANYLCAGEASRHDIGCPTYAPYVDTTGSVGIGTTSTSSVLNVSGTTRIIGNGSLVVDNDFARPAMRFIHSDGTYYPNVDHNWEIYPHGVSSTSADSWFDINTRDRVSGVTVKRLSLSSNGAMILGASNGTDVCNASHLGSIKYESNAFYVCQNATNGWEQLSTPSSTITLTDRITSGTTKVVTNQNGYISLTTGGTTTGYFDTAGRLIVPGLGIGTVPARALDISISSAGMGFANFKNSAPTGYVAFNLIDDANVTQGTMGWANAGAGLRPSALSIGTERNSPLVFYTSATERVRIDGEGKVGIGTTAPAYALDISSSSIRLFTTANALPGNAYIQFAAADESNLGWIGDGSAQRNVMGMYAKNGIIFAVSSSNPVLTLNSNTLIGIGTMTPTTVLDISGTLKIANSGETCDASRLGAIKYDSNAFYICQNTAEGWEQLSTPSNTAALAIDDLTDASSSVALNSVFLGSGAGNVNTGAYNTAVGIGAMASNTTGAQNTAMGQGALATNTSGLRNDAYGVRALFSNTTGSYNIANGFFALLNNTTGNYNTGVGYDALMQNQTGSGNTALGLGAGTGTSGASLSSNTLIGYNAGHDLSTGSSNIALGYDTQLPAATSSNALNIGNSLFGDMASAAAGVGGAAKLGINWVTPSVALEVSGTISATQITAGTVAAGGLAITGNTQLASVSASSNVSVTGNVSAAKFIGDGSALTGVNTGTPDKIVSGTTNVTANTTGYISLTTGGATTGYFDTAGRLILPGVSVTTANGISSTNGYFSGKVGIGNSSPGYDLTIGNGARTTSVTIHLAHTGGGADIGLARSDNDILAGSTNADLVIAQNGAARSLLFGTNGTEKMRIDANGNVGIGTTSPSSTLYVYNASGGAWATVDTGGTNYDSNLALQTLSGGWVLKADGSDNGKMEFMPVMAGSVTSVSSITMVLTKGNQVGISTSTPQTTLDVNGTLRIANSGEACDSSRLGAIRYTTSNFYVCKTAGNWEALTTSSGTTVASDRITSSTTNVTANQTGYISITTAGVTTGWFGPYTGLITIGVSSTGGISATNGYFAGNFGIGTAPTSSYTLDVKGRVARIADDDAQLLLSNAAKSGKWGMHLTGNDLAFYDYTAPQGDRFTLQSGGYVGIGTTNPTQPLDVSGTLASQIHFSSAGKGGYLTSTNDGFAGLSGGAYFDGTAWQAQTTGAGILFSGGNGLIAFAADSGLTAGTAFSPTVQVSIYPSGHMGVGTRYGVDPSATLEVSGTLKIANSGESCDASHLGAIKYASNAFYVCQNTSNGWQALSAAGGGTVNSDRITSGTTSVTANTTGYISLTTGGATTGYFDTAGRLIVPGVSVTTYNGVSSTNAYISNALTLNTTTNAEITFTGSTYANIYHSVSAQKMFLNTNSGAMVLGTAGLGSNNLYIEPAGNIGIGGVVYPSATLDVSGTLKLGGQSSDTCNSTKYGTLKIVSGKLWMCRQD